LGAVPDIEDPLSTGTRNLIQQIIGKSTSQAEDAVNRQKVAKEAAKTSKALDTRIKALVAWVTDLESAIEVLKKDNFPKWARDIKMADLVDVASEHLSEMTDGRYRFDLSLKISDETAGIVRKASTLSGGEKFEASLALALGVSEIAGRSGVRIETLFLDEGFAGLDQSHLNRALDALENEVAAGRRIVLITHIGSVADRIPDVLLIQPDGAGGSTTKWLDEDERFELGADLDIAVP
jgi:exonuclease SbcC